MANIEPIDTCTNSIESVIADETLDDLILNAIYQFVTTNEDPTRTPSLSI